MGSMENKKPHIVAFPFPLQGHINPMLVLCQRFCESLDFSITFVNSVTNHDRLLQAFESPFPESEFKLLGLPDGLHCLSPGMDGLREAINASHSMKPAFEQLVQKLLLEGSHISCILSDVFVTWTLDVAKQYNIPFAAYSTTSATNDVIASHLPRLIAEKYVPMNPKAEYMEPDHRIDFIPGITPMHPLELPYACRMKHPINNFLSEAYKRRGEADYAFVNSVLELEENAIESMRNIAPNYFPIGPVLPVIYTENTPPRVLSPQESICLEWLDKQSPESVLYVSFGSIACLPKVQIEHLLLGLKAAQQPFLLVIRDTLVLGLPGDLYDDFVDSTKDYGYIMSWAPQMEVLGHPSVGGFLSHCGWNSTLEALYNGVPVLGWPCMAEQNLNCRLLVKEWKVALGFKEGANGFIDKSEIENKVRRLMQEEEGHDARKRMSELKEKVRSAVTEGGSSRSNLEEFATAMRTSMKPKEWCPKEEGLTSQIQIQPMPLTAQVGL